MHTDIMYLQSEFKYSVMNNKALGNIFRNSQKSFHNSPRSSGSNHIRGYRSFFKLNNSKCTVIVEME